VGKAGVRADSCSPPPLRRPRGVAGVSQPFAPHGCPEVGVSHAAHPLSPQPLSLPQRAGLAARDAAGAVPVHRIGEKGSTARRDGSFHHARPPQRHHTPTPLQAEQTQPGGPFVPGEGVGGPRSSPPSSRRSGNVIKGDRALKGFD